MQIKNDFLSYIKRKSDYDFLSLQSECYLLADGPLGSTELPTDAEILVLDDAVKRLTYGNALLMGEVLDSDNGIDCLDDSVFEAVHDLS